MIKSSEGTQVAYFYTIHRKVGQGNTGQKGVSPYTVVPCKLCYLGLGSDAGDLAENSKHTQNPPSDNANVLVSCAVGGTVPGVAPEPAKVTNDGVATVGWLQVDSPWTVTFKGPNPCLTTNSFSSDGGSQCSIDPKASATSYIYDWTLTSCNGSPANGKGTVVLYAPPAPPPQPQQ